MRDQRSGSVVPGNGRRPGLTPEQRMLRARLAARTMHSRHDPRETTAVGRAAFMRRFEREVDPDGVLSPAERQRRAGQALRAHMSRLALASSKARGRRTHGERSA